MSLVVGQYRQLLLFNPTQSAIRKFVEGDLTLGTAEHGTKVILQNWGQRRGHFGRDDYPSFKTKTNLVELKSRTLSFNGSPSFSYFRAKTNRARAKRLYERTTTASDFS